MELRSRFSLISAFLLCLTAAVASVMHFKRDAFIGRLGYRACILSLSSCSIDVSVFSLKTYTLNAVLPLPATLPSMPVQTSGLQARPQWIAQWQRWDSVHPVDARLHFRQALHGDVTIDGTVATPNLSGKMSVRGMAVAGSFPLPGFGNNTFSPNFVGDITLVNSTPAPPSFIPRQQLRFTGNPADGIRLYIPNPASTSPAPTPPAPPTVNLTATALMGREISVPYWLLLLCLAILPSTQLVGIVRRWRRSRSPASLCLSCGYDLRFTPQRCPECGVPPRST